jgi:sugar lactone lactonase YvrE
VRPVEVTAHLELLMDGGSFFESPRWHDGRVWVSDLYEREVVAVTLTGTREVIVRMKDRPSGLGWLPDGDLLVVSMIDQVVLRVRDGEFTIHADLAPVVTGPLNDMIVDDHGRAYVGSYGFDFDGGERLHPAGLVRVDPDGSWCVVAGDLRFPNGCALADGGRTLIVAETFAQRLTAFRVADDGSLHDERTWAQFERSSVGSTAESRVAPDGVALDAEGCLWVADANGRRVLRVKEGGMIVDEISTDPLGVFACAFVGEEQRSLVLCCAPSADPGVAGIARRSCLLLCPVDVPGAGPA